MKWNFDAHLSNSGSSSHWLDRHTHLLAYTLTRTHSNLTACLNSRAVGVAVARKVFVGCWEKCQLNFRRFAVLNCHRCQSSAMQWSSSELCAELGSDCIVAEALTAQLRRLQLLFTFLLSFSLRFRFCLSLRLAYCCCYTNSYYSPLSLHALLVVFIPTEMSHNGFALLQQQIKALWAGALC